MSTGVYNPPHKSQPNDLDSVSRSRPISRSNGSVSVQSIDHDRIFDKQPANMAQTQRTRYLKTGAIIAFVFMVLVWLSPSKSAVSSFSHGMCFLARDGSTIKLIVWQSNPPQVAAPQLRKSAPNLSIHPSLLFSTLS
jgi:hypothetical protein